MCGRFTLIETNQIGETFDLSGTIPELLPRYNVAPSQTVAVVAWKRNTAERALALLSWGLVPSWTTDPKKGPRPINARADSLDKATFRDAFRSKRCLIPADGFYEWATVGSTKRATHFRMKDRSVFAFAGLWEFWVRGTEKLATCCLITTDANELVTPTHNRMPVILPKVAYSSWLSADSKLAELSALLKPYSAEEMEAVPVGPQVNSAKFDNAECVTAAP